MTIYRNYGSSIKHSFSTPGEPPLPVDGKSPIPCKSWNCPELDAPRLPKDMQKQEAG